MRVFVSQPMNGRTEKQIQDEKNIAGQWIEAKFGEDTIAINGYMEEEAPCSLEGTQIPLWYLAKSIEKLAGCDAIFLVNGWQKARGCRAECAIAQAYGLPIIVQEILENKY